MANQDVPRITVYIVLIITIIATFFLTLSILKSPQFIQDQPDTLFVEFGPQGTHASVLIVKHPEPAEEKVAANV